MTPDGLHEAENLPVPLDEKRDNDLPGQLILFTTVLVAVNAIVFALYASTHQGPSRLAEGWEYLASEPARLVTLGVGIPLLLLLLERHFGIADRLQERANDRRRLLAEDQKARSREEREARIVTMRETIAMWQEALNVGYSIVYTADDAVDIGKMQRSLREQLQGVTPILSIWRFRFPNLSSETINLLHEGLERFLGAVDAALSRLASDGDPEEHEQVRMQLATVLLWMLRPLRSYVEVFSLSVALLEQRELATPEDSVSAIESALDRAIAHLRSRIEQTRTASSTGEEEQTLPMLPPLAREAIEPMLADWKAWLRSQERPSTEWPGFAELERQFASLPVKATHDVHALRRDEFRALADRCRLLLMAEFLRLPQPVLAPTPEATSHEGV